ncbi:ABC transporter permease [Brachybacterium sp. UMB0905]|uniref:ABC transporter permease n=1 Tax=Brachybacterium sp. UMB0905 TaxID=2069310 RepID=UPI0011AFB418|nr:ABC transporter permease [Brachybacterium sp. UMB0905]
MSSPTPSTIGQRMAQSARHTARSVGSIRIPEAIMFFVLLTASGLTGISTVGPIPTSHLLLSLICVYALLRRPTRDLGQFAVVIPVFAAALFYIGMISMFATPTEFAASWETRLLRLLIVTFLVFVLASGRIDPRSATTGAFTALVVNIPLFYAGFVSNTYGGALTGLIGDKNVAGLAYTVVGLLMVWVTTRPSTRALVIAFSLTAAWLTESRTSIAALVAGLVWMFLAPRLPVAGRWVLGVVLAFMVDLLAEDYSRIGVFSDRLGSDLLRSRIDAASRIRVEESGFFGQGLGEAYVVLDDRTWFFHNSYWSALVEGGWPWTIFLVAVTALLIVRPFSRTAPPGHFVTQGAGIAILVCATRLGEVFYTNFWALALGTSLYVLARPREPRELQPPLSPAEAAPGGVPR